MTTVLPAPAPPRPRTPGRARAERPNGAAAPAATGRASGATASRTGAVATPAPPGTETETPDRSTRGPAARTRSGAAETPDRSTGGPAARTPPGAAEVGWPARTELRAIGIGGGLGPGAVRVFWVLGLHPGPSADTGAVAALAGLPRSDVRTALATLVAANLVTRTGERYAISHRLRAYATDHPVPDAAAARARLLQHLAATATAAAEVAFPSGPAVTLPPFGSPAEARDWLDAERPTLLAIRDPAFARRLAPILASRSRSGAELLETALDRERAGRWVEALAWFAEAYELCLLTGDRLGQAVAAGRLAAPRPVPA